MVGLCCVIHAQETIPPCEHFVQHSREYQNVRSTLRPFDAALFSVSSFPSDVTSHTHEFKHKSVLNTYIKHVRQLRVNDSDNSLLRNNTVGFVWHCRTYQSIADVSKDSWNFANAELNTVNSRTYHHTTGTSTVTDTLHRQVDLDDRGGCGGGDGDRNEYHDVILHLAQDIA